MCTAEILRKLGLGYSHGQIFELLEMGVFFKFSSLIPRQWILLQLSPQTSGPFDSSWCPLSHALFVDEEDQE